VGSSSGGNAVNKYSSEKSQLDAWLKSIEYGIKMLGNPDSFSHENKSELEALNGLRRFAFSKTNIKKGAKFNFGNVYFAIPGTPNQYSAKDFGKYSIFEATEDISEGQPISHNNSISENSEDKIFPIRESVLKFVKTAGIVIPRNAELEISHHFGIESFHKHGSCMITVVNKDYCKKYIILLPGQDHPDMYHKVKDETFFLLTGDLSLRLDGKTFALQEGETSEIPPLTVHGFKSINGAIIEEVSTSHSTNDSFYINDTINMNSNRKTIVRYWL
jgi:quercetin dioxygenase-like cupin family protein